MLGYLHDVYSAMRGGDHRYRHYHRMVLERNHDHNHHECVVSKWHLYVITCSFLRLRLIRREGRSSVIHNAHDFGIEAFGAPGWSVIVSEQDD